MFGFKKKRGNGQVRFDRMKTMVGGCYLAETRARILYATLIVFLSVLLFLAGAFSMLGKGSKAFSPVPTGSVANNLYDEATGEFDGTALTELAKTQNYENLKAMVAAAESGTIVTGDKFGSFTLKFGSYSHLVSGEKIDLVWQPTYLSKDKDGNAILTLWLASSETANTSSNQELSWFSDGTQSYRPGGGSPKAFNDEGVTATVESNCYDGSYIRFAMIKGKYLNSNGSWKFASAFGSAIPDNKKHICYSGTRMKQPPAESTLTKFSQFNEGGLFEPYIVKPNNVQWQLDDNNDKNDLGYTTNGYAAAYTNNWGGDNLWLPGKDEIKTGALWKLTQNQLKYPIGSWLRTASESGSATDRYGTHTADHLGADGSWEGYSCAGHVGSNNWAVRPCFHLNLSEVAEFIADTPEITGSYDYNRAEHTVTIENFDTDRVKITDVQRTDGTANVAPVFTETSVKVTDAGEYTVTFETKNGTENGKSGKYYFSNVDQSLDTPDTPYKVTKKFTVKKAKLDIPGMGTKSKEYDGTTQTFTATNYITQSVTVTPAYPVDPMTVTVSKTGGWGAGESATVTAKSDRSVDLGVKNAGEYKASFEIADEANYEWSDGTNTAKEIDFTITKKKLTVSYETDPAGGTLSWAADDTTTATFKISGISVGDNVILQAKITKDEDATFSVAVTLTDKGDGTQEFVLDTSVFGGGYAPGHYPITFDFLGGTADGNYDLTNVNNTMSNEKFVVGASGAGLTVYNWKYTADGGALTPMPSTGQLTYAYNKDAGTGVLYRLTVDTSSFEAAHIELDEKYVDEEGNPTAYYNNEKNLAGGPYETKVAIKVTDPDQYAFTDGSTSMEVTYRWSIEKATIDASAIKWQYTDASGNAQEYDGTGDGIPWKGTNYTLTLKDLPAGVTVNPGSSSYSGNQAKGVGTYTATCTSLSYDTNNYNTIASPTLTWKIKAQRIEINNTSWLMDEQGGGGQVFYLPHLNNPYDGTGIVYEYYDLGTDEAPIAFPGTKLNSITEIEVESGTQHYYYVKALIAGGKSTDLITDWADALELDDTTTQPNGACTMAFRTGDNRAPVSVTLNGNPVIYDGETHGKLGEDLFIKVGSSDFDPTQFHVDYYAYDETAENKVGESLSGDYPKNAGKYVIVVSLESSASEDYFLNATTFVFEILPYEFDMSGVRWGYVEEDGKEVVYNPSLPPRYTRDKDGNAVEYELKLVGFPKGDANGTEEEKLASKLFAESGLEGLFTYTGNKQSAVNSYTAGYTFDVSSLSGNYRVVSMPDGSTELPETQGWRIAPREIIAPENKTVTFTGEEYDLLSLGGLDAETLDLYYTLSGFTTVDENNETVNLLAEGANVRGIKNAGEYRVTLTLKDESGTNVKWLVNGSHRTTAQTYTITISKLVITVTDWEGEGNEPYLPIYGNGEDGNQPPAGLIENAIYDSNGNRVEGTDWATAWNQTFTQKLVATTGNEGNVEIVYADGIETEKTFTVGDDPSATPAQPIGKPKPSGEPEKTFNGQEQDFTPEGMNDLADLISRDRVKLYALDEEGNEIEVDASYFRQRNAGKYKVIMRINGNYKWSETNDKSDAVYEFEVKKAELTASWETGTDGKPTLVIDEAYRDLIEYEYRDETGKVIAEKDLKKGKQYTVTAKLKESEAKNADFMVEDAEGNVEAVTKIDTGFTMPGKGGLNDLFGLSEDFPLWQIIVITVCLILFIIFMILAAKNRKEKKEAEKEIKKYKEDLDDIEGFSQD